MFMGNKCKKDHITDNWEKKSLEN